MLTFRPHPSDVAAEAFDLLGVAKLIDGAMCPGNFFLSAETSYSWIAARAETIPWEIFRGQVVPASQTRMERTFLSWHLVEAGASESTISVKLDAKREEIHVTRGLLAYVWEGFDAGGASIETREVLRWSRELVGTISLREFRCRTSLRDELICQIWQAVVGTSRLPLTSVEAPLPGFTFGHMHYVFRDDAPDAAITSWETLVSSVFRPELAAKERVKIIEFVLRHAAPEDLPRLVELLSRATSLPMLWRRMFNAVSLSPYTHFVDNALTCIDLFAQGGAITLDEQIDFLGHLLRQLGRHLTAYDLVTFHHRGANYPDALLLDAVLRMYLRLIEHAPERFLGGDDAARLRRRALRQGCLMRRRYEGHLVPDWPTSPGENARVMPSSQPRVPEEQFLQPLRRKRKLFSDDPLSGLITPRICDVFALGVADLAQLHERAELGLGLFIDRPLGYAKRPGAPDQTPLLAHEAFSLSVAQRCWSELQKLCMERSIPIDSAVLEPFMKSGPWPTGLPHTQVADCPRPTAALGDVRKVADDFVIVRTLRTGLMELMGTIKVKLDVPARLCIRNLKGGLLFLDEKLHPILELSVDASAGYSTRAGVEFPIHVFAAGRPGGSGEGGEGEAPAEP